MSSIPQWFVQQWDTAIRAESAQRVSRLAAHVTDRGQITGESFSVNFMGDDGSLLDANTVRHGDTTLVETDHQQRIATMSDFFRAYPLDRNDIPKMLVNPVTGGDYMKLLMAAKNRRIDDIIYNAARGSVLKKDGTSTALPSTQKVAVSASGFTKAKLITTRKIFRRNECDAHNEEVLNIAYNDEMLDDILTDTTLTSADFMAVKMLQEGDLSKRWMGFNWIPFNGITKVSTDYFTIAWATSGIHFGRGYEEGNVSRRPDKKELWQVSMGASYAAARQDEKKIVEIAFT
jgi:hypothetical protein